MDLPLIISFWNFWQKISSFYGKFIFTIDNESQYFVSENRVMRGVEILNPQSRNSITWLTLIHTYIGLIITQEAGTFFVAFFATAAVRTTTDARPTFYQVMRKSGIFFCSQLRHKERRNSMERAPCFCPRAQKLSTLWSVSQKNTQKVLNLTSPLCTANLYREITG